MSMSYTSIPWSSITHLYLCCADASTSGSDNAGAFLNTGWMVPSNFGNVLSAAHANGVKVIFNIGYQPTNGWTTATAPGNVDAFVAAIVAFTNASHGGQSFDGVDLDWEITINSAYTAQYVTFIQKLRTAFTNSGRPNAIITMTEYPLYAILDVAGQASASLTGVEPMCYDMDDNGANPAWYNEALLPIGSHLDASCQEVAVKYLVNYEHVPANKIIIGVESEGHVWYNCPGGPTSSGCTYGGTGWVHYNTIKTSAPWTGGTKHWDNTYKANWVSVASCAQGSNCYVGYADTDYMTYLVGTWIPTCGGAASCPSGFLGSYIMFGNDEYIASGATQAQQFPLTTAQAGGAAPPPSQSPCDLNNDGVVNSLDVTLAMDAALGNTGACNNLDGTGVCTVIDVQRVIDASLNGSCRVGP